MQSFLSCFNVIFNVCGVCLVLAALQKMVYNQCLNVVGEVYEESLKDYMKLARVDLDVLRTALEMAYNANDSSIELELHWNIEITYLTATNTEFALFISEFMHPECSSSVAMTYVPFSYPYNNILGSSWTSAAKQAQNLRKEIELVRSVENGRVKFEDDLKRMSEVYARVFEKFTRLRRSIEQLAVIEANFPNSLRTFPYNVASLFVPRLKVNQLFEALEAVQNCDYSLKTFSASKWRELKNFESGKRSKRSKHRRRKRTSASHRMDRGKEN